MASFRSGEWAEVEGGDEAHSKHSSKYARLFAKMWGNSNGQQSPQHVRSEADLRVSNSSSAGSFTNGMRKGTPSNPVAKLRGLPDEGLLSREGSMVMREGSVVGSPTMKFKQPNPAAIAAIREQNAQHVTVIDSRGQPVNKNLNGLHEGDGLGVSGRVASEAMMVRPQLANLGVSNRSFTTASSPSMKKLANGAIVTKVQEYVSQHAGQQ